MMRSRTGAGRWLDRCSEPGYALAIRGSMPTFTFTYTYAYRLFTGGAWGMGRAQS
jgi:hypothetical protein